MFWERTRAQLQAGVTEDLGFDPTHRHNQNLLSHFECALVGCHTMNQRHENSN